MKDLLYKEFKLAVHPSTYLFLCFSSFLLIPSWPYFIAFGYIFMGFMNTFFIGRTNQDIFFTASLPVRKKDVVRARILSIAIFEMLQVAAAIPFAILNTMIYPQGNMAGMNTNFAFFGFALIMYAIFNGIFFPMFYKSAYKVGIPILVGVIASSVFAVAVEFGVHTVPFLITNLNAKGAGHLESQLPVLAAGIVLFCLSTWLSCRKAESNFEKVDL
ncbi:MAG: ABC-2 transporter permease [Eubacteriales bacterium]